MKKSLILLMAAAALFATACNSGSKIGDYETVYNGYIYNAGEGENGPTGSISTLNLETGEVTPNGYLLANNADMDAPVILVDADNRGVSDEFASKVREIDAKADVWQQPIGPVIGAHAGPGTIGIIFMTK